MRLHKCDDGHYRLRVSGPLLDRIDLGVGVPAVLPEALALNESDARAGESGESSATVRERVARARRRQQDRQGKINARLLPPEVATHCVPEAAAEDLLARAMTRLALSARAYHRVLKVARTIADLAGADNIDATHMAEAIGYRRMDTA